MGPPLMARRQFQVKQRAFVLFPLAATRTPSNFGCTPRHADCTAVSECIEEDLKMRTGYCRFTISALALCGAISLGGQAAEVPPPNPPRSQQDLGHEREAACRDLHGPELKECMANYVGTPDKPQNPNPQSDRGTPGNSSEKAPVPIPPSEDRSKSEAAKK